MVSILAGVYLPHGDVIRASHVFDCDDDSQVLHYSRFGDNLRTHHACAAVVRNGVRLRWTNARYSLRKGIENWTDYRENCQVNCARPVYTPAT